MFESKQDIEEYFSHDKIQCLLCNRWFKSLSTHLYKAHDILADDYRRMFDLPFSKGLCGESSREKFRKNAESGRLTGRMLTGFKSPEHEKQTHKTGHRRQTLLHRKDRGEHVTALALKNRKYPDLDFDECMRLSIGGMAQWKIAKKFGVAQITISRFLSCGNKYQDNCA